MTFNNKVYFKTSEKMSEVESKTIQMVVTSPPYWDLKNYRVENQIGYDEDYEKYLGRLYKVWKECFRVLKDNGVTWININTKSYDKSLVLIPFDFIKQMKSIGFYFKDILIWHKSSGIPSQKNLNDHFEYFLLFTKNKINFKNYNIFNNYFDYKLDKIVNYVPIWNINKKFGSVGKKFMIHPAIFPVEFIERLINIFTDKEDVILDPFLGSGTTLIAAIKNSRNCIGYELNKDDYKQLIISRLKNYKIPLEKVIFY